MSMTIRANEIDIEVVQRFDRLSSVILNCKNGILHCCYKADNTGKVRSQLSSKSFKSDVRQIIRRKALKSY